MAMEKSIKEIVSQEHVAKLRRAKKTLREKELLDLKTQQWVQIHTIFIWSVAYKRDGENY